MLSFKKYTCLVVEDNASTLALLVRMLGNIGFQGVQSAGNGKEAWQIIQAGVPRIDLVISDMLMPEEDGLQLLQHIRHSDQHWHLPFIMITCVNEMGQFMSVTEEHVDAYLVKPVTEVLLRRKVVEAVKRAYDPDPYHRALFAGRKFLRAGEHEMALHSLQAAQKLQPGQSAVYFTLAQLFEKLGKIAEAEQNYQRCNDRSNDLYVRSLDGLARIYWHKGDHDNALSVLNKAIAISPDAPDRHMDLAIQLKTLGKTEEAKSSLVKALKLSTRMTKVPKKYIETCMEFGMEAEALSLMERGVSDHAADIIFLNKMGIVCRRDKKFELAQKYYKRALKTAPDDETLNYNYAVLLVDMEDYPAARSHLYNVLSKNPESAEALSLIIDLDKAERY